MKYFLISFIFLITIGLADDKVVKRKGEPDFVQGDSEKLKLAINESKKKIGTFIAEVKKAQNYKGFFVKKGFKASNGEVEHIWLSLVKYKDNKFFGKINNKPVHATTLKVGQLVEIEKDKISDWMITSSNGLKGGFTVVALVYGTNEETQYQQQLGIDWKQYDFIKKIKK